MSQAEFQAYQIKHRRVRHDLASMISLKTYCEQSFCRRETALYRIGRGEIIGYKLQGRWYVVPPDAMTTIEA